MENVENALEAPGAVAQPPPLDELVASPLVPASAVPVPASPVPFAPLVPGMPGMPGVPLSSVALVVPASRGVPSASLAQAVSAVAEHAVVGWVPAAQVVHVVQEVSADALQDALS